LQTYPAGTFLFNCALLSQGKLKGIGIIKGVPSTYTAHKQSSTFTQGYTPLAGIGVIRGNVLEATVAHSLAALVGNGKISGYPWVLHSGYEWVWNSKIGVLDFTIDKSNQAGQRPMEFGGFIYAIKKLGNEVIVYGQNGVGTLSPAGVHFGRKTIYNVGLIAKNAVCGTEQVHYFIDSNGIMWKMSGQGLEMIDYSNWFSALNNRTVMTYNEKKKTVHICDGVRGFVYSESGLGKGPINITGMGLQSGIFYVSAPVAIVTDPLQVATDIIDFGSRDTKYIDHLDVGMDVVQDLYMAVEYRLNKGQTFFMTPWIKADYTGTVHLIVSGIEFRFWLKVLNWEQIRIDYINVSGKQVGAVQQVAA